MDGWMDGWMQVSLESTANVAHSAFLAAVCQVIDGRCRVLADDRKPSRRAAGV